MKKQEYIDRYSDAAEGRTRIADNHLGELIRLTVEGDLDEAALANAHDSIVGLSLWDAEIDQREVENLIAVANSNMFDEDTRELAIYRVKKMLELNA